MLFHFKDILQHFKFVNWRIRGFVFWCHEQVNCFECSPELWFTIFVGFTMNSVYEMLVLFHFWIQRFVYLILMKPMKNELTIVFQFLLRVPSSNPWSQDDTKWHKVCSLISNWIFHLLSLILCINLEGLGGWLCFELFVIK